MTPPRKALATFVVLLLLLVACCVASVLAIHDGRTTWSCAFIIVGGVCGMAASHIARIFPWDEP